jgi:hypothetical protein
VLVVEDNAFFIGSPLSVRSIDCNIQMRLRVSVVPEPKNKAARNLSLSP